MNDAEKQALEFLSDRERLSAAAVVRRLIWRAARRINASYNTEQLAERGEEEPWWEFPGSKDNPRVSKKGHQP